ncbi:phytoene desaturase family protein [Corynebacterium sp. 335C]
MTRGWPVAQGGSGAITAALASVVTRNGGRIHLNSEIRDIRDLRADAVVLNLAPGAAARIGGADLPERLARGLRRWRHGPGVHKVDYFLDGPVPWSDPATADATTMHVGGTAAEMAAAEDAVAAGRMPDRPFVMVCQQDAADPSRTPEGRRVLWTYAHVPACAARAAPATSPASTPTPSTATRGRGRRASPRSSSSAPATPSTGGSAATGGRSARRCWRGPRSSGGGGETR